jgi:ribosomal-protein-serine acetyltransferase
MFTKALTDTAHLEIMFPHHAASLYEQIERDRERFEAWLPWCPTITDEKSAGQFIERFLTRLAASDGLLLGIWSNGDMAGGILLRSIDWSARRTEAGYWIAERYAGQGLVTRAAASLLDYVFDELKLEHVTLQMAVQNHRSRAVAERLGFSHEGTLRHAYAYPSGILDHDIYGLLADEWRSGEVRGR